MNDQVVCISKEVPDITALKYGETRQLKCVSRVFTSAFFHCEAAQGFLYLFLSL